MLGRVLGRVEVWVLFSRKAPSPPTTSSLMALPLPAGLLCRDFPAHLCVSSPFPPQVPQGWFPEHLLCGGPLCSFLGTQHCPPQVPGPGSNSGLGLRDE